LEINLLDEKVLKGWEEDIKNGVAESSGEDYEELRYIYKSVNIPKESR